MPATSVAERREFRESVRSFVDSFTADLDVNELLAKAHRLDPALWSRMAAELGVQGLLVPEKYDGQGLGLSEATVVLEEAARALLPAPYLASSVLATWAILASGDDSACAAYLPGLASGETIAAIGFHDSRESVPAATRVADEWSVSGQQTGVLSADVATLLLVVAAADGELGLFAVAADASGLDLADSAAIDLTRPAATITFESTPAVRLGGDFAEGLDGLRDVAAIAAAAESVGVCERSLRLAVSYAKQREQFGRPIGSFQAVKHMCAEMLAALECGRAAVSGAAGAADDRPGDRAELAAVAKAYCSTAGITSAESLVQILAGIGYTWEHPAHLLLRRAKSLELGFGEPTAQRERLAVLLGLA